MSIYRPTDGWKLNRSGFETVTPGGARPDLPNAGDVPPQAGFERPVAGQTGSERPVRGHSGSERPDPVQSPDWSSKRRAVPVEELMKVTLLWAASLPPHLRPQALLDQCPRVANLAAACWKEPASFHACVSDLVVVTDRRGLRQGFPVDVLAELINLQTYNFRNRYSPLLAQRKTSGTDDEDPVA